MTLRGIISGTKAAGIPLTHRDVTTSLAMLTGHERPERRLSSLDWDKLANGIGTLIFDDDLFTHDVEHALAVCEAYEQMPPQPPEAMFDFLHAELPRAWRAQLGEWFGATGYRPLPAPTSIEDAGDSHVPAVDAEEHSVGRRDEFSVLRHTDRF